MRASNVSQWLMPSRLQALGRWTVGTAVAAALGLAGPGVASASPIGMSADEFRLYKDYSAALTDARVQKLPEAKRLSAIAKNFKVNEKSLKIAIEKGEQFGATAGQACEKEVRALLNASALKGRVQDVKVDDADGHVVTYISWKNENSDKLDEEAALAALLAAKGAPITSTIAVWSTDKTSGRKVFEAKIGAEAASHFSQERIQMFATARYIRVFENVHNAYKGTPPLN
jgi:hypothetical protein